MKLGKLFLLIVANAILLTASAQTNVPSDYMKAYVVVADSSHNYDHLSEKMLLLSEHLPMRIDTTRIYDREKNLICLPADDEDQMYAGSYAPRRYPSDELSIEYLYFYKRGAPHETMVLVVSISEDANHAYQILKLVQKVFPEAFLLESNIYIGCTH